MIARAHPEPSVLAAAPASPARSHGYVPIPHLLLLRYQTTPQQIGVYGFIGRLYLIAQRPIPLSPADLTRIDPSLSRGAALRLLDRLSSEGWLVRVKQPGGKKPAYRPSWGYIRDTLRLWEVGAPRLGRPRHVLTFRLDRRLFDLFLGRALPADDRPILLDSYLSHPVLSFHDIGSYALASAGYPCSTPTLARCGLVRDGLAQPLPDDDALILTWLSQLGLHSDGPTLTLRGLQRLGVTERGPLPPAADLRTSWLFFVPRQLIGMLIGGVIASDTQDQHAFTASGSAEKTTAPTPPLNPWSHERTQGAEGRLTTDSSSQAPQPVERGGGSIRHASMQRPQSASAPGAPATSTTRLLRELNVFPAKIAQLADVPAEVVEAAIAHARSRADLHDLAGYVVRSLEAWRRGWRIPAPLPTPGAVDLEKYTSGRYAALFTRDVPTAPAAAAAPAQEAPAALPAASAAVAPSGRQPAARSASAAQATSARRPAARPAPPAQPIPAGQPTARSAAVDPDPQGLAERLRGELARRAGPRLAPLVAGVQIVLRDDVIILGCASRAEAATVSAELQPLLPGCLGSLGLRGPLRSMVLVRGAGVRS